jgi:hypothetical protein
LNQDPPDLCLLCDYRHESLVSSSFFFFFFFLVGLGFELRVLHLQTRCSPAWATTSVHFALVILEMGS